MILDFLIDKPRLQHQGDGNHPNHSHANVDVAGQAALQDAPPEPAMYGPGMGNPLVDMSVSRGFEGLDTPADASANGIMSAAAPGSGQQTVPSIGGYGDLAAHGVGASELVTARRAAGQGLGQGYGNIPQYAPTAPPRQEIKHWVGAEQGYTYDTAPSGREYAGDTKPELSQFRRDPQGNLEQYREQDGIPQWVSAEGSASIGGAVKGVGKALWAGAQADPTLSGITNVAESVGGALQYNPIPEEDRPRFQKPTQSFADETGQYQGFEAQTTDEQAVSTTAAPPQQYDSKSITAFYNQAVGTADAFSTQNLDLSSPEGMASLQKKAQSSIALPPGDYIDPQTSQVVPPNEGRLAPTDERKLFEGIEAQKQAADMLETASAGRVKSEVEIGKIGAQSQADQELLAAKNDYAIAADIRQEQMSFNDWARNEKSAVLSDVRARIIQGDRLNAEKSMARMRDSGETERLTNKIRADMSMQGRQISHQAAEGVAERFLQRELQSSQHNADLNILVRKGMNQEQAQRLQGLIDKDMARLTESGDTNRLAMQIRSQENMAGREMSIEMALAGAERQLRTNLQETQIESEIDRLKLSGDQDIEAIRAKGSQERAAIAQQISAQASMQGEEHSHEYYQALASRQQERMMQTESGRQELERIKTQAEVAFEYEGESMARAEEADRARRTELATKLDTTGTPEQDAAITQARDAAITFTGNINAALKTAATDGDFDAINTAIAAELPPLPAGIAWDRTTGSFQQREGFQGREIDPGVQRFMSATSSAFRARDRAEQVSQKATEVQTAAVLERQKQQQAEEDFRQAMTTNEIDSAEEALARQAMAETAAVASKTKLEHLSMLLNLMQNPVQLGMAKRHGLLGQIETTLGFNLSNVPEAPTENGGVPNANQWTGMDSESQAFSIAAYIEQGGSPDEFMRMISASAPAALQQTSYATLGTQN